MREISGKEYAELVEDTIVESLENAVGSAYTHIMRNLGMGYDEREVNAAKLVDELWQNGEMAVMRDFLIKRFEEHGLDVYPDGKEW